MVLGGAKEDEELHGDFIVPKALNDEGSTAFSFSTKIEGALFQDSLRQG